MGSLLLLLHCRINGQAGGKSCFIQGENVVLHMYSVSQKTFPSGTRHFRFCQVIFELVPGLNCTFQIGLRFGQRDGVVALVNLSVLL